MPFQKRKKSRFCEIRKTVKYAFSNTGCARLCSDVTMTSESPEASISSSVDVTAAQTGGAPVSLASPMIVRATLLLVCAVINLCGNGFTLVTIRTTPRLWTKTNFILASMLLSNVITGVFMLWYTPLLVVVHVVFNNPCRYIGWLE